jgi:hypothetical protein
MVWPIAGFVPFKKCRKSARFWPTDYGAAVMVEAFPVELTALSL